MDSWLDSVVELQTSIEHEEYQRAIDLCKQILQHDNNDVPASVRNLMYECQATSFLHLQQYQNVVDLAKPKDLSEDSNLQLLQAYALYRQERYHQAKVLLLEQNTTTLSAKLLLAQIQYHLHETKEVLQIYTSLLNNIEGEGDEARTEIVTNALATLLADATPQIRDSAATTEDSLQQLARDILHDDDYDGWYNLATWLHLTGTPSQTMLERARHGCIRSLSQVEGLSVDDRTKEVAPMETNLLWAQQWSGHTVTPISNSTATSGSLPTSVATIRAINEALTMSGDNHRALKALLVVQMELPSWPLLHQRLWWYNCAVLQVRVGSVEHCRKSCKSLQVTLRKEKRDDEHAGLSRWWWQSRLDVLEAWCLNKEGKQSKAMDLLKESVGKLQLAAKSSPSETLDLALAHLQLHLFQLEHGGETTNNKEATTTNNKSKEKLCLLEALPSSIRSQRAVVATLASLYQSQGDLSKASKLLQDDELAFGDFCMAQGNYDEAAAFLQEGIAELDKSKSNNSNKKAVLQAKLVEVLSYVDPSRAQEALSQLSYSANNEDDNTEWNAEELEAREVPRSLATAAWKQQQTVGLIESKQNKNKNGHEANLRRRANKRKEYLKELEKKGQYNPNHPAQPDPERWIPKHERSSSRRKGRKGGGGGGDVHRGAQGGASEKDAAKLDVAARQAALAKGEVDANGPSTAHMTVSSSGMTRRAGRRR